MVALPGYIMANAYWKLNVELPASEQDEVFTQLLRTTRTKAEVYRRIILLSDAALLIIFIFPKLFVLAKVTKEDAPKSGGIKKMTEERSRQRFYRYTNNSTNDYYVLSTRVNLTRLH